jgi:hypothetical protein
MDNPKLWGFTRNWRQYGSDGMRGCAVCRLSFYTLVLNKTLPSIELITIKRITTSSFLINPIQ